MAGSATDRASCRPRGPAWPSARYGVSSARTLSFSMNENGMPASDSENSTSWSDCWGSDIVVVEPTTRWLSVAAGVMVARNDSAVGFAGDRFGGGSSSWTGILFLRVDRCVVPNALAAAPRRDQPRSDLGPRKRAISRTALLAGGSATQLESRANPPAADGRAVDPFRHGTHPGQPDEHTSRQRRDGATGLPQPPTHE